MKKFALTIVIIVLSSLRLFAQNEIIGKYISTVFSNTSVEFTKSGYATVISLGMPSGTYSYEISNGWINVGKGDLNALFHIINFDTLDSQSEAGKYVRVKTQEVKPKVKLKPKVKSK